MPAPRASKRGLGAANGAETPAVDPPMFAQLVAFLPPVKVPTVLLGFPHEFARFAPPEIGNFGLRRQVHPKEHLVLDDAPIPGRRSDSR